MTDVNNSYEKDNSNTQNAQGSVPSPSSQMHVRPGAPIPPFNGEQSATSQGGAPQAPISAHVSQQVNSQNTSAQQTNTYQTSTARAANTPYSPAQSAQSAQAAQSPDAERVSASAAAVHHDKSKHVFAKAFAGAACGTILCLALAAGGLSIYQGVSGTSLSSHVTTLGSDTSSTINAAPTNETLAEQVAQKALPSVVCIYVYKATPSLYGGGRSGADDAHLQQSSLGSGIVLSKDGYVLTNYHVVANADALKVNVGGEERDAKVVGADPSSDLAVVKVDNVSNLKAADLGDSSKLKVGEWVMSIGSPFGLEQSVATGVVSATSRSQVIPARQQSDLDSIFNRGKKPAGPTIYPNMIQTDAAINPGNSGGALVDAQGRVIGVNTLITSNSGNYSGVGFAIPINYALSIAKQIIEGKTPTHARLGASLSTVNPAIARHYGLGAQQGAYVASILKGSGADQGGLQEGDIITKFNDKAVTDASSVMVDVREQKPGDSIRLVVVRGGKEVTLSITLGNDQDSESTNAQQQQESTPHNSDKNARRNFLR